MQGALNTPEHYTEVLSFLDKVCTSAYTRLFCRGEKSKFITQEREGARAQMGPQNYCKFQGSATSQPFVYIL